MARISSRQWLVLVCTIASMLLFITVSNKRYSYSLVEIQRMIGTLELKSGPQSTSMLTTQARITDNNSPDVLAKHQIEVKVNELLKAKIEKELELERKEMKKKVDDMKNKIKQAEKKASDAQGEKESLMSPVQVNHETVVVDKGSGQYRKTVYSFKTQPDDNGKRLYDSTQNKLVIMSGFTNNFGKGRTHDDFLNMIDTVNQIPHSQTSLSLLISNEDMFKRLETHISTVFNNIKATEDVSELAESFSKVTLVYAPFLEEKLNSLSRGERQKAEVQRHRRRVLAEMRNFLMSHGIENEEYSLYIDCDMIELPKNMLANFISSDVDIGTIRIDMKNPRGVVTHPDYDLNAWAGSRLRPTEEQEKQMDNDPNFFFEPKPAKDAIHMLDLSANRDKFGLDNTETAKYELKSVGGAVLFVRANVYRQGAIFPPYYAVGTNWQRLEGWDGIETEGLCYIANAMGYKCWGFPNMVGYHTV